MATAPLSFALFSCQQNRINLVNPFIGKGGHGHTYPCANVTMLALWMKKAIMELF